MNLDKNLLEKKPIRTSIIWLMPVMAAIYILSLVPFGINPAHWKPLLIALGINIGVSSVIQTLWLKLSSFGAALLSVFLPILLIGIYLHALAPLILAILIVASIYSLTRIRKVSFEQFTSLGSMLFICGAMLSLILFQRSDMGYSQPFMGLHPHRDTLFHMAVSSMIKSYGVVSIGLHGLHPLHYHTASHMILAGLSLITKLSVFDTYAYLYPLVFIPLLLTSFLCFTEELMPTQSTRDWLYRTSALAILLIGLNSTNFQKYAFWLSFYISESYTVSIILLIGLLSALIKRERASHESNLFFNTLTILYLFILICLSKISVGFVALAPLATWTLFGRSKTFISRSALGLMCLVSFYFVNKLAFASSIQIEFFHFFKNFVANSNFLFTVPMFFLFHLFFSNLVMIGYIFRADYQESWYRWLVPGIVLSAILGVIPGILLNIPGGSAYYFSNVSQLMALPILIILFIKLTDELPHQITKFNTYQSITSIIAVGYFMFAFYPSANKILSSTKSLIKDMRRDSTVPYHSHFIERLQKIRNDSSTRDMMVYLPHSEQSFWSLENPCMIICMQPAISERAAIRSLPAPACLAELGNSFHALDYDSGLLESSQHPISNDQLLKEAHELGFKGVIILGENGTQIIN